MEAGGDTAAENTQCIVVITITETLPNIRNLERNESFICVNKATLNGKPLAFIPAYSSELIGMYFCAVGFGCVSNIII